MDIKAKLKQHSINYLEDEPLARHTWYKIGGKATIFALPKDVIEIKILVKICGEYKVKYYVLGGGANVLFSDEGFDGVIISTAKLDQITKTAPNQIVAQAGAQLQDFIDFCIASELDGFCRLSGIPGTIGGNIKMNAGAFGQEISDHLQTVEILENDKIKKLPKSKLGFRYRQSAISASQIVLTAEFKLQKGQKKDMQRIRQETIAQRQLKQPTEYPSCGSVFKKAPLVSDNPKNSRIKINIDQFIPYGGIPAGVLIEAAGLKGASRGGAQFSPKHANFIVNTGGATASDVLYLINKARQEVYSKTGFILEPEVRLIGLNLDKLLGQ